jgi:DNA polymerase bacteriophage-type
VTDVLHFDIETRSQVDLRKVGAHVYLRHPSTQAHCLAYAVNDEPVKSWVPPDSVPVPFQQAGQPGSPQS